MLDWHFHETLNNVCVSLCMCVCVCVCVCVTYIYKCIRLSIMAASDKMCAFHVNKNKKSFEI